jgi:hypothetical protein
MLNERSQTLWKDKSMDVAKKKSQWLLGTGGMERRDDEQVKYKGHLGR